MAKASRDLERRLKNLETWLDKVTHADAVGVHIRDEQGRINLPLSTDEREGKKPVVVAQIVGGRRSKQSN